MKKIFAVLCFVVVSGISNAQSFCEPPPHYHFKVITPAQIFHSTGHYMKGVGCRVLHGTKKIITAPFCAPICLPKPKEYIYVPGRWYYLNPPTKATNPEEPVESPKSSEPPPKSKKKTVTRTMWV